MHVPEAPSEPPRAIEPLVDALVDGRLAKYLLDSDTASRLIREIAAETGLPRAAVRIAFKLLAPLLVKKAEAAAGWFGGKLVARSADLLARLPFYAPIAAWLLALRARLDADVARSAQLDAILAGDRPAADLEDAKGLSQELQAGLRQLGDMQEMRAWLGDQFDQLFGLLNPQPPLSLKLLPGNDTNRLKFGAQRVPFLGRAAELARLRAFLDAPRAFSWWLVTGSGGQGKSRLALELCLRAGTVWRTGFLDQTSTFDGWDGWQPEAATLIVVDYVATRVAPLRRIIASLLDREQGDPLDAPVRLLLLERSKERSWWDQLIGADQTGYAIEQCQFDPVPLDLGPMTEDDLWRTIVTILKAEKAPPDRAETLAALARIDPERRPLFAAFAADALAAGANIRAWDRERLLRDVLQRERKHHWLPEVSHFDKTDPDKAVRPYENLLCLATMTGGLALDVLAEPPVGIELPASEAFAPAIYRAMAGAPPNDAGDLPALQPDILGEFFVLDHLTPPHPGTKQPAERFRQAAWLRPARDALAFALFLDHAKDDFLDHPTLPLLLAPPSGKAYYRRHFWAMLAVNLIDALGSAREIKRARTRFEELRALAAAHPTEVKLRLLLAQSAVNLIADYGKAGQIDEALALFEELRALAELVAAHPIEAALRLRLGQGAVNVINALGNAGQIEEALALFEELRALAAAHPAEAALRLRVGQGAFNLIIAHGRAGQLDEARAVAKSAKDALLSAQFAAALREQFGEEPALKWPEWLRSALEP